MEKNNGNREEHPLFYAIEHIVDGDSIQKLKEKYQGLICWNIKNIRKKDLTYFKDTIIIKNILH